MRCNAFALKGRGVALLFMALGVIAVFMGSPTAHGQTFAPYADFQALTLDQLATLQVKLTYVGVQNAAMPSLGFTSSTNTFDVNVFTPFQRPEVSYFNDTVGVTTFSATPAELKAAIDNVATLPNVTAGGVAANAFLSFALFDSQPSEIAFEAILDRSDAADLFDQLRASLANNKTGGRRLAEMACPLDLSEAERPTDVSSGVGVTFRGVRLDRNTGLFVGTALLSNTDSEQHASPVSLMVDLQGNVRLVNADGTTCTTSPVGREYINLASSLDAGETAEIALRFDNADREAVKLTTKVLSGPGAR